MKVLFKPNQFSKYMQQCEIKPDDFINMIKSPAVIGEKASCPLLIYGEHVENPELNPETRFPRCTASNVKYIYMLQLDYDSGTEFHEFIAKYKNKFSFAMYSSHSFGYKPGDRFRVLIPLKEHLDASLIGPEFSEIMCREFPGVDPSCFVRGHFQIIPAIRESRARYAYAIEKSPIHYEVPVEEIKHLIEEREKEREIQRAEYERRKDEHKEKAPDPARIDEFVNRKLNEFGYAEGSHHVPILRCAAACAARGFEEPDAEIALLSYTTEGHPEEKIRGIVSAAYEHVSK